MALASSLIQQLERNDLLKGSLSAREADQVNCSKFSSGTICHHNQDSNSQSSEYSDSSDEVVLFHSSDGKKRGSLPKAILAMWPCLLLLSHFVLPNPIIFAPIMVKAVVDQQENILLDKVVNHLEFFSIFEKILGGNKTDNQVFFDFDKLYLNHKKKIISKNKNNFFSSPKSVMTKSEIIDKQLNFFPRPSAPKLIEEAYVFYAKANIKPSAPVFPLEKEGGEGLTVEREGGMTYARPPKYNPEAMMPNLYEEEGCYNPNAATMPVVLDNPYYDQPEGKRSEVEITNQGETIKYNEHGKYGEYANNNNLLFSERSNLNPQAEGVTDEYHDLTNSASPIITVF